MTNFERISPEELAHAIRNLAVEEGFAACGIAPAVASNGFSQLIDWIEWGYAANMNYFRDRLDAYRHPEGVLPGAQSVIVLVWPYDARDPHRNGDEHESADDRLAGRVARYTWPHLGSAGQDYHDVIHPKLKRICRLISSLDRESNARGVIDTAPLMEREIAELAGLGWRGKNTLLLNKTLGSYFLLACVLVDVPLPYDSPQTTSHCGTCSACLDACPTDAFVAPHVLDASRCISYLTIEHRDDIPESLREGIGDWLFGCDVCQEVCPWNRKPTRRAMLQKDASDQVAGGADSTRGWMELLSLFGIDDEAFRTRFRSTPMWRSRRRGLLRNAAIVLGNLKNPVALPVLQKASDDEDPLIRDAATWAIGNIRKQAD